MKKRALLLAANPKEIDIYGNILAHAMYLAKNGGVFWSTGYGGEFISEEFKHKDIKVGYFYNTISGKVDHWFKISFIRAPNEIIDRDLYDQFVPPWRKEAFYGEYTGYWILITKIYPLKLQYDLQDFVKSEDGRPVQKIRAYSIVIDEELERLKFKII
jgi:hypothetical protein